LNIPQHIYLVVFWILFCVLHSVFAARWWKLKMSNLFGSFFRFYRFFYSIFATVNLSVILYLLIVIESPVLWTGTTALSAIAIVTGVCGICIMLACSKKYFSVVTGIRAFSNKKTNAPVLQTGGLHSYTRHPLYFGTLVFVWSLFLIFPMLSNLISCCLISLYTIVGIHIEERKLIIEFGEQYKDYARKVPMLLPYSFLKRSRMHPSLPETV
jgi:methanethiol S-methyltransferase